jgi:cbb3-type cytochrome oxidase maturation protein
VLRERGRDGDVSIIFYLIPLGLVLLALAVAAFFWAVRSGQFDDLETPAWRILLDDDAAPPEERQIKNFENNE